MGTEKNSAINLAPLSTSPPLLQGAPEPANSPNHYHAYALPENARRVTHRLTVEESNRCGYRLYDGTVRVIACIEDTDIIDRMLAHLRRKEQVAPTLPLLAPLPGATPATLPLFSGREPASL